MVQGRLVAVIDSTLNRSELLIQELKKELQFQYAKSAVLRTADGKIKGKAVTILGDENIHYDLLKKILATCREANYTQIAFAAIQKTASRDKS